MTGGAPCNICDNDECVSACAHSMLQLMQVVLEILRATILARWVYLLHHSVEHMHRTRRRPCPSQDTTCVSGG